MWGLVWGSVGDRLGVRWGFIGVLWGSVGFVVGSLSVRWGSINKSIDEKTGMTPTRKLEKVMNWDEET